jgi:gamma-glutamyl hercynylcysteine S-oxide synthase
MVIVVGVSVQASQIADRLRDVRDATVRVVAPLDEDGLRRTPDPILSPPLWDLGHIGAYEELWLLGNVAGRPSRYPELQATYDAFETPRAQRTSVEILGPDECWTYLDDTRADVLHVLDSAPLENSDDPLVRRGAAFEMVAQHEAQHSETILQALQMLPAGGYVPEQRSAPAPAVSEPGRATVHSGSFTMGSTAGFAYDCERPAHERHLAAFEIATLPVTNGEHMAFIADGGYRRREFWCAEGWEWVKLANVNAPLYWEADAPGAWTVREFERTDAVDPRQILCHVSWFEANAHARWAGARLPTEAEWERAAAGADPSMPANLGQRTFAPGLAGAESGAADSGCRHMLGDVWEWTSTQFAAYPGFRAFPYPEYAEVYFNRGYRVLRGGSWATQSVAARTSFRNWDLPQRRQIFAGLRLAWTIEENR